jgi:glycosyltransferase involved in cell wall biosynthesis
MKRHNTTFISTDPPIPPTGGGTRAFHFVKVIAGLSNCHLFVLSPMLKSDFPASTTNSCSSVNFASDRIPVIPDSPSIDFLKKLRMLFAPWSVSKCKLILSANYWVSNPYIGKNIFKKVFYYWLRHTITWYALSIYRLGYTIPARSLERYGQFKEMKLSIKNQIDISEILWIDFSTIFPFLTGLDRKRSSLKIICNAHNVEYKYMEYRYGIASDPLEKKWYKVQAELLKEAEIKGYKDCDLIITCSEDDRAEILSNLPKANIEVIPNGVDVNYFIPNNHLSPEPSLLFTGTMGFEPNKEAVDHFIKNIFPLVLKKNPSCKFMIAGANAAKVCKEYVGVNNIEIISSPLDIRPYYNEAWIVVVPLRSGSGTRLKILEAMAMEKPVVSTVIGAEGLTFNDGKEILIALDDDDFAKKINNLFWNKQQVADITRAAREKILKLYDWERIEDLVSEVISKNASILEEQLYLK